MHQILPVIFGWTSRSRDMFRLVKRCRRFRKYPHLRLENAICVTAAYGECHNVCQGNVTPDGDRDRLRAQKRKLSSFTAAFLREGGHLPRDARVISDSSSITIIAGVDKPATHIFRSSFCFISRFDFLLIFLLGPVCSDQVLGSYYGSRSTTAGPRHS